MHRPVTTSTEEAPWTARVQQLLPPNYELPLGITAFTVLIFSLQTFVPATSATWMLGCAPMSILDWRDGATSRITGAGSVALHAIHTLLLVPWMHASVLHLLMNLLGVWSLVPWLQRSIASASQGQGRTVAAGGVVSDAAVVRATVSTILRLATATQLGAVLIGTLFDAAVRRDASGNSGAVVLLALRRAACWLVMGNSTVCAQCALGASGWLFAVAALCAEVATPGGGGATVQMRIFPLPMPVVIQARLAPWIGVAAAWLLVPNSSLLVHAVGCAVGAAAGLIPAVGRVLRVLPESSAIAVPDDGV